MDSGMFKDLGLTRGGLLATAAQSVEHGDLDLDTAQMMIGERSRSRPFPGDAPLGARTGLPLSVSGGAKRVRLRFADEVFQ